MVEDMEVSMGLEGSVHFQSIVVSCEIIVVV